MAKIATLDEQIRTSHGAKLAVKELQAERANLLIQLAAPALAQAGAEPAQAPESTSAREAQATLRKQRHAVRELGTGLFPRDVQGWWRVGVGYAAFLAVGVCLGVMALSGDNRWGFGSGTTPMGVSGVGKAAQSGTGLEPALSEGKATSTDKNAPDQVHASAGTEKFKEGGGQIAAERARKDTPLEEEVRTEAGANPRGQTSGGLSDQPKSGESGNREGGAAKVVVKDDPGDERAKGAPEKAGEASASTPRTKNTPPGKGLNEKAKEGSQASTQPVSKSRWSVAELEEFVTGRTGSEKGPVEAVEALGQIGKPALAALIRATENQSEEVRAAAVYAIGRIGLEATEAVPVLIRCLRDQHQGVRWCASTALSRMGEPAVGPLTKVLADEREFVRWAAATALGNIGSQAKSAVPSVQRLLRDGELPVREAAGRALQKIDPEANRGFAVSLSGDDNTRLDPLVEETFGRVSSVYRERGFKDLKFGTTVQALERTHLAPERWNGEPRWWVTKDETELRYADIKTLIGITKRYEDNNEGYLEKLKDLFGPAAKENIETYVVTNEGRGSTRAYIREDILRATYRFPDTFVVVEAFFRSTATRFSTTKQEIVVLIVYDARWATRQLDREICMKRKAMDWLRPAVKTFADAEPDPRKLPEYPGAARDTWPPENIDTLKYSDKGLQQLERPLLPPDLPPGAGNSWFCAFSTLRAPHPREHLKQRVITFRFGLMPEAEPNSLWDTGLHPKVVRCNCLLAQEYFPPKGTTITVVIEPNSTVKTYEWRTKENWKVQVTNYNGVVITIDPAGTTDL